MLGQGNRPKSIPITAPQCRAKCARGIHAHRLAFLSVFAGLCVGDFGVYFATRFASSRKEGRLARWLAKHRPTSEGTLEHHRWTLGVRAASTGSCGTW